MSKPNSHLQSLLQSKVLWSLVTILLAFLTIRLVINFSGGMSLQDFLAAFQSADPLFLITALAGMFGFIFFEGEAVLTICRSIGFRQPHRHGFLYAAADTYFSAITPSATGGQPASALFMMRDGIPGTSTTAVLVFNLIMYTLAALVNGLLSMLIRPSFFLHFSTGSKLLILFGLLVLIALSSVFWLVLKKRAVLTVIADKCIRLLTRIRLVRHPEKQAEHLHNMITEYGKAVDMMTGQRRIVIRVFILNLLQRFCQISITVSMYLALGGKAGGIIDIYATQSMVVLGSNSVPIPGSMGITDLLMLDGYMNLMSQSSAFSLELLSRSISFYLCVLLSGLYVLAAYLRMRHCRKKTV